jgi:hypothetical protein
MTQTCQETTDCTGHGWVGGGSPLVYEYGTTFTTGNPIIGETVDKITYYMKKDSGVTSTDNIYMKHDPSNQVATNSFVINDLTTDWVAKQFNFTTPITVANNDKFIVYQDGTVSASEKWGICESATPEFTGNTTGRLQSGSWSATNGSTRYCFTSGTTPPSSSGTRLPPPPAFVRI